MFQVGEGFCHYWHVGHGMGAVTSQSVIDHRLMPCENERTIAENFSESDIFFDDIHTVSSFKWIYTPHFFPYHIFYSSTKKEDSSIVKVNSDRKVKE